MNFKIIEVDKVPVCIYRSRNENGNDIVTITAFVEYEDSKEGDDYILEDTIIMPNGSSAKRFIKDLSVQSASEWIYEKASKEGIEL